MPVAPYCSLYVYSYADCLLGWTCLPAKCSGLLAGARTRTCQTQWDGPHHGLHGYLGQALASGCNLLQLHSLCSILLLSFHFGFLIFYGRRGKCWFEKNGICDQDSGLSQICMLSILLLSKLTNVLLPALTSLQSISFCTHPSPPSKAFAIYFAGMLHSLFCTICNASVGLLVPLLNVCAHFAVDCMTACFIPWINYTLAPIALAARVAN